LERFTGASAATARKQLVIVSDMIEHVPGEYTQYPPADLRYDRFRSLPAYRKVHTDLKGAEVIILYVQRLLQRPIDTGAHIKFWTDWIAERNAATLRTASWADRLLMRPTIGVGCCARAPRAATPLPRRREA